MEPNSEVSPPPPLPSHSAAHPPAAQPTAFDTLLSIFGGVFCWTAPHSSQLDDTDVYLNHIQVAEADDIHSVSVVSNPLQTSNSPPEVPPTTNAPSIPVSTAGLPNSESSSEIAPPSSVSTTIVAPVVAENSISKISRMTAKTSTNKYVRPSRHQKIIYDTLTTGKLYLGLIENREMHFKWKEIYNYNYGELKVSSCVLMKDLPTIYKFCFSIEYPVNELYQILTDEACVQELDKNIMGVENIGGIRDDMIARKYIFQTHEQSLLFDSPLVTTWKTLTDGSIIICSTSAPDDWCPENDEFFRIEVVIYAIYLKKRQDDQTVDVTVIKQYEKGRNLNCLYFQIDEKETAIQWSLNFVENLKEIIPNRNFISIS